MISLFTYIYIISKGVILVEEIKPFLIRIPKETWVFYKRLSIDQERHMNEIINDCLEKYKKRVEKRLTKSDSVIS